MKFKVIVKVLLSCFQRNRDVTKHVCYKNCAWKETKREKFKFYRCFGEVWPIKGCEPSHYTNISLEANI